jgi:hypothetical protein
MKRVEQFVFRVGCSSSVLALILGLVLYPKAKWLFAFVLLSLLPAALAWRTKEPSPQEVADLAERILRGECAGWDVDDYEHLNPKDPLVRALWAKTLIELPEKWAQLEKGEREVISVAIRQLRELNGRRN